MTMLISLISIFSYGADWHFTFQVNRDGTITSVNNSYHHAGITVTINSIIESENGYIGADITYLEVKENHMTSSSFIIANQSNGSRTIITSKKDPIRKLSQEVNTHADVILIDGEHPY